MLDRPHDAPDNNFDSLALAAGEGMLCLAPHPDDEVLGCAGLLMLAQRQGLRVHTIIVTAGEQGLEPAAPGQPGEAGHPRLAESQAAARTMGLPEPVCWHLADRALRHAPPLIARITEALSTHQARWLLLPALTEPHPDHQALALAGMAAAQRHGGVSLLFYEVGAPTQPNTLVDISAVAHLKWQALEAFASQEERHAYRRHAQAMATVRAFVLGPDVQAAEAYWQLPAQALAEDRLTATLGGWPLQRSAMQLASTPQQLPLVSCIVRSMNRPSLADAIASVAAQTYPNIEVVVVNACGGLHPQPAYPAERLALRVVGQASAPEGQGGGIQWQPLSRSAAANLGLQSMQGEFGLFLDDDDLLQPVHLQNLVKALQDDGRAAAAYSGVRVEGPAGQWLRDYDTPWQHERLWGINYLPIHAVLFRHSAVHAAKAQFDEQLPVMEDWDFWCQLSHQGPFVHVPGIGATYRQGLGTSQLGDAEHANYWAPWHRRILEQHAHRWGVAQQSATLAWHAVALDRTEQHNQLLLQQQQQGQAQLQQLDQQLQQATAQLHQQTQQLQATREHHERDLQRLSAAQQQLQQTQVQQAHLQAEHALAQRSLQLLQQSRPVRGARALRRLLGRGQ
ncbi:PIG-L family deacetylase [Acidovorax sp. SRB_24]|uniref:PIG-L family deacetylase n=1 Tax=Acidovorax sp. SRB_24 TaxID=1962700 RepID=UPI00145F3EBA|nr:PIG-L family deacetylase [Acidovorax sp. SRB_24]NMM78792.1 hypothetical protein [Acidovorax sp. SRB_24]